MTGRFRFGAGDAVSCFAPSGFGARVRVGGRVAFGARLPRAGLFAGGLVEAPCESRLEDQTHPQNMHRAVAMKNIAKMLHF